MDGQHYLTDDLEFGFKFLIKEKRDEHSGVLKITESGLTIAEHLYSYHLIR